jgi:hypothetical protein
MNKINCLLVLFLIVSCQDLKVKKTSSEIILNEELETFNWNEVDQFPSFSKCENFVEKELKRECFQNIISSHIYSNLAKEQLIVSQNISDTIMIQFLISETGKLSFLDIEPDSLTLQEIPNLKSLITNSIVDLPQIYPAIKRGQQVKTAFKLPLIINVE